MFALVLTVFLTVFGYSNFSFAQTSAAELIIVKDDPKVVQSSPYQPLILSDVNKALRNEGLYIAEGELRSAQMGNILSMFFEGFTCSDITGIHFAHRRPPIKGDEQAVKFFSAFPLVRVHPNPVATNFFFIGNHWRKTCPAIWPYPHSWAGAWNQRPALIADVMHTAIKAVFDNVFTTTIPVDSFAHVALRHGEDAKRLPLVPSVAIMMRCVDILHFVQGQAYGFLNFNAYLQLIPQNASTIYVLSEPLGYLNFSTHNQRHCKEIGEFLVSYLHTHYPSTTVALRRGHPIDSVAMLSNTPMLISAPSTFSLFPGIANPNQVYTMPGVLYYDKPFLHANFRWITYPTLIYPGSHMDVNTEDAIVKLKALFTAPLERAVEASIGPV